jgi:histidinol-phosphatase (PHP family)
VKTLLDYHMHTFFSQDGKMTMNQACEKAVSVGLDEIAITDHMDIDLPDNKDAFQIADMDKYIESIRTVKEKFKGRLKVKTGIEIGLQDWTLETARSLVKKYPYDFVIASIHIVDGLDPYFPEFHKTHNKVQSYTSYYRTIYELLKDYDDFNVWGHLDYVRRYIPEKYEAQDHTIGIELVEAILKLLVERGKGLEVNTKGYMHYSKKPHPHPDILKWFRELGGEIITIGSDAHSVEYVGYENKRALEWIKNAGFDYVTSFTAMKPEFIRI